VVVVASSAKPMVEENNFTKRKTMIYCGIAAFVVIGVAVGGAIGVASANKNTSPATSLRFDFSVLPPAPVTVDTPEPNCPQPAAVAICTNVGGTFAVHSRTAVTFGGKASTVWGHVGGNPAVSDTASLNEVKPILFMDGGKKVHDFRRSHLSRPRDRLCCTSQRESPA
jgi:hypothetical protein